MTTPRLFERLYGQSPYDGLAVEDFPLDLQGWGADNPLFALLMKRVKPQLIIEVGTWKGASAVHMGKLAEALNLAPEIICIDTFLGSWENWYAKAGESTVGYHSGRPRLLDQFLANVVRSNLTHCITPLPLDSGNAAKLLSSHATQADMIYIDASHEYDGVRKDLNAFWELLRPGGVFFGDDYTQTWPGVIQAVTEFSAQVGVKHSTVEEKWYMHKPE